MSYQWRVSLHVVTIQNAAQHPGEGTSYCPVRSSSRPQKFPRDDLKCSPIHSRPRSPPESRIALRTKHSQEEKVLAHRTSCETKTPQAGEDGMPPPRNGKDGLVHILKLSPCISISGNKGNRFQKHFAIKINTVHMGYYLLFLYNELFIIFDDSL